MNREQSIEFIQAIEDTKALERAILDIIDELKSEGSKEIADGLEQLIPISNNRFSVIGQKELLQESKRRAISMLKSEPQFNHVSEKEACCIVERVLGNVQFYLQDMFKRQPHTKCTDSILSMQKCFDIGNEYDLQHIVYALLRAVFPLARIEEYQDAGACAVRKDICIDEFDIAIELKCTRDSLSAKKLSEEVASDIVHYDNKNIFFLIYDKARIIDNIDVFKEIFDSYASGNLNQRFDLIYKNYHTFPKLIDSFETGVFNMILNEREYNRRAKNKADLGVRVQTSNKSDPTAKLAEVNHDMAYGACEA